MTIALIIIIGFLVGYCFTLQEKNRKLKAENKFLYCEKTRIETLAERRFAIIRELESEPISFGILEGVDSFDIIAIRKEEDGTFWYSIIKRFTDEDKGYAYNCAVELKEKLEEKI